MRQLKRFVSFAIFISVFILLSLIVLKAQDLPNYLFLEVIDSKGKAVANAKVDTFYYYPKFPLSLNEIWKTVQTDAMGKASVWITSGGRDSFTTSCFRILKEGYFPFQDFGIPINGYQTNAKVELLKIPNTEKERQIIGSEQLKREFLLAAKKGEAAIVRNLLKSGISPNLSTKDLRGVPGPENIPAILFAADSGDGETVKTLLKAGADIHKSQVPPLINILSYYLRADPFSGKKAETEAEKKLMREHEEGLKSLLNAGAEFNNLNGSTALKIAAQEGSARSVRILLDKGGEVNAGNYGWTALASAVQYSSGRPYELETINLLFKAGADPNILFATSSTETPCRSLLMDAVERGRIDVVNLLIKNKADVNFSCQNRGWTALKIAQSVYSSTTAAGKPEYAESYKKIIKILEEAGAR